MDSPTPAVPSPRMVDEGVLLKDAPDTTRRRVMPEDIFPYANRKCKTCWGAGKFIARRAVVTTNEKGAKASAPGEREECLCPCATKRFLKQVANVDVDISKANAGAMWFRDSTPAAPPAAVEEVPNVPAPAP